MRLAIAGASGFVGAAICNEAQRRSFETVSLLSPRLRVPRDERATIAARRWVDANRGEYSALMKRLRGVDVLLNAAGLSAPDSNDVPSLRGGNATVPVILGMAAAEAGVRRMVHISSSAVQGRREPLDETSDVLPLTPYGRAKAEGEAVLLERQIPIPKELTVYRPTSVQGASRTMTRQLVKLANLPVVPLCADGNAPLPVALIDNVAAGILAVCEAPNVTDIVLHPWEGMTVRSLFAALGSARPFPVPTSLIRGCLHGLYAVGPLIPRAAAVARRLELITGGQRQEAFYLRDIGFVLPIGPEGYVDLADQVRRSLGPRCNYMSGVPPRV